MSIRCWIHERHPIAHTPLRVSYGVFREYLWENWLLVNSLWPNDITWHNRTGLSCLSNGLSPVQCQVITCTSHDCLWDPWDKYQTSKYLNISWKYKIFHTRECLQNSSHFVQASMCWSQSYLIGPWKMWLGLSICIFRHASMINILIISCDIALRWMPCCPIDDKSTLDQVMAQV